MTISEVKQIFERQFGNGNFPEYDDERAQMTSNDLYQFAHAVVREHLAKQLERANGPIST